MRLLIDLQGAQTESRFRGIGRYASSLTRAIIHQKGQHEVFILLNGLLRASLEPVIAEFEPLLPPGHILIWNAPGPICEKDQGNQWRRLAAQTLREAYIEAFAPDFLLMTSLFEGFIDDAATSIGDLAPHIPTAVILHDLIPYLQPETYLNPDPVYSRFYREKIAHLKRAHAWLANSESSAKEGRVALGFDASRITTISAACDDHFRHLGMSQEEKKDFLPTLGLHKAFILYTGGGEARKNVPRLVEAFARLPKSLKDIYQLVLAGKMEVGDRKSLEARAKQLDLPADALFFTGYVDDETLVRLYNCCALFVFPSLHEGFGLPVLEAIACGAVAIASNSTSLPEVLGTPDALFDPTDTDAISRKIEQVLTDPVFRARLEEQEAQRKCMFSWDQSAQKALQALEMIAVDASGEDSWRSHRERLQRVEREAVLTLATLPGSPTDLDIAGAARCLGANQLDLSARLRAGVLPEAINWQIEGPFDSSYSLALVNRETARALDALGHRVSLESREGGGPFEPDPAYLESHPDVAKWHRRASEDLEIDVASRFLYPPVVTDMPGRLNFLHGYCWEETGFPYPWIQSFNEELQGVMVASEHVRKILLDNGLSLPVAVTGLGVDHFEQIQPDSSFRLDAKTFRFLHVSSCFPRKGVDVLLRAYGSVFSGTDDVSLVIKTFPNPHNEVAQWLDKARKAQEDFPDVVIVEEEFSEEKLKALYLQCDALVAPSRAEGFGLPLAEAMLTGLPVITTGWSGQADFCTEETAWLVDYDFRFTTSHLDVFHSVWAEPREGHLAEQMKVVHESPKDHLELKKRAAEKRLKESFRWLDVAQRMVASARVWSQEAGNRPRPMVGWVTTWNTRCGIATYSEHLLDAFPAAVRVLAPVTDALVSSDDGRVERCWTLGEEDDLSQLGNAIEAQGLDTLVIQFNYGFFNLQRFADFLEGELDRGRILVLVLHATTDPVHHPHKRLEDIAATLRRCHRLLVHSVSDLNRLKALGLIDNVALFPHGLLDAPRKERQGSSGSSFVIASYGFFLPHKGLLELIEAVSLVRRRGYEVILKMVNAEYPAPESSDLIRLAEARIRKLGLAAQVHLTTDFLTDAESLSLLSEADLILFPYQVTGESASGAVRYGIASGSPVAVTPLPIFEDVAEAVITLPGCTPEALAQGIVSIIEDLKKGDGSTAKVLERAEAWRDAHRYPLVSERLYGILCGLHANLQSIQCSP